METDKANPNSRNQVRNETNFAFKQQNIKYCLSILGSRAWTPRCYRNDRLLRLGANRLETGR